MYTCYIQSFKILAGFCRWAGWFGCYLVQNPRRHIFAWCGSYYYLAFMTHLSRSMTKTDGGDGEEVVLIYVIGIYMPPRVWNGGLMEPLLNIGAFRAAPHWKNKGDFGTKKIQRNTYFFKAGSFGVAQDWKVEQTNVYFWKGGSYGAVQVEKVESLGAPRLRIGGFRAAPTRTVPIWEYHPTPPPGTKPTIWPVGQRRLGSVWVSAQSDQSLFCALSK